MKFKDAKKLHNGDQVIVEGVVCKVLSTSIIEGSPPGILVRLLMNDGSGPYREVSHLEVD